MPQSENWWLSLRERTLSNDVDLLNPLAEVGKRKYKLKRYSQTMCFILPVLFLCFFVEEDEWSVENERLVWRRRDGDEDDDEENDEIDYKRLKGEVSVEELLVNMLGLTNDGGDDSRQNQSKYLCRS
ncbi:hypothetical protein Tco_0132957 [Tanacetum coccineum]